MKVYNLLNEQNEVTKRTDILCPIYKAKKEIEEVIHKSFKDAVLELLGKSEEEEIEVTGIKITIC